MKVIEQVLAKRIREQVKINDKQFGFTSSKSMTYAIFIVRQLQETFEAKDRTLFYAFVDRKRHLTEYQEKWLDGLCGRQVWRNGWSRQQWRCMKVQRWQSELNMVLQIDSTYW